VRSQSIYDILATTHNGLAADFVCYQ